MSGPVSSALVSEAVSRTTSFLTGKYSERKSTDEYRDRLEILRIKFKSVIGVSEAFDTVIEPLLEWEQKFKDALSETEKMLGNFNDIILMKKPNRTVEGGSPSPDQSMQEEGSDDAPLVHPASNLREAVTRQVDLEENLPHDPFMQEEVSDDATWVHPASNPSQAVNRQVDLEANLPHDPFMQEEVSDDATSVHLASNLSEAVNHQVGLEAAEVQSIFKRNQTIEGGSSSLVYPDVEEKLPLAKFLKYQFRHFLTFSRVHEILELIFPNGQLLEPRKMVDKYLENDEKVSKLIKTVEKLEKMAGDIGNFVELLKLQSKRKMSRKRKRIKVLGLADSEASF